MIGILVRSTTETLHIFLRLIPDLKSHEEGNIIADMEHQDWTTVVLKRRVKTRSMGSSFSCGDVGGGDVKTRDMDRNERMRMSKMADMDYAEAPKKQVASTSLQELIRKRMELKINQEKADQLCHFPRHTFCAIESRRTLPTSAQQSTIQKHLGVQLKIVLQ